MIILGNSTMDIRSWILYHGNCMRQSCLNQPLTQRTHHCCIFHSAVCKAENFEAIIQLDKFCDVNNLEELEIDRDFLG